MAKSDNLLIIRLLNYFRIAGLKYLIRANALIYLLFRGLHDNLERLARIHSVLTIYYKIYMHIVLLKHSLLMLMGYFRELSNLLIFRKLQARKLI